MLTLFYPILSMTGYGMTWQNMIVMMWGGLRGAVSICLALDVFRNEHFCDNKLMGAKVCKHKFLVLALFIKIMFFIPRCYFKRLE
jgi:NhaP-type Na+/H+ or K+/H+ antiporter